MKTVLRETLLWLLVLFAPSALAADDGFGVLAGRVYNRNDRQPLADVAVTVGSPHLYMEEQTVVTDENGFYRIPQLPPGVYSIRFETVGFQPMSYYGLRVRLNRTQWVHSGLEYAGLAEQRCPTSGWARLDVPASWRAGEEAGR